MDSSDSYISELCNQIWPKEYKRDRETYIQTDRVNPYNRERKKMISPDLPSRLKF